MRIFPTLKGKRRACVNLDALARQFWADRGVWPLHVNPFLRPESCTLLVERHHATQGVTWSLGGYMENRSTVWAGSYLAEEGKWTHLGIDCNVPAGTLVAVPRRAQVVRIDDDTPEPHGWGGRVIMKDLRSGLHVIYAHLDGVFNCVVGDVLEEGFVFAVVGKPEYNGGWYPHLHLQAVAPHAWRCYKDHLSDLDGYGLPVQERLLRKRFPHPIVALGL